MTTEQVRELVRSQAERDLETHNLHEIALGQALVQPVLITIIVRTVENAEIKDEEESVWLIGKGPNKDGYRIVMHEQGYFGLASSGFARDRHPVLVGWYGDLLTTFMAM